MQWLSDNQNFIRFAIVCWAIGQLENCSSRTVVYNPEPFKIEWKDK